MATANLDNRDPAPWRVICRGASLVLDFPEATTPGLTLLAAMTAHIAHRAAEWLQEREIGPVDFVIAAAGHDDDRAQLSPRVDLWVDLSQAKLDDASRHRLLEHLRQPAIGDPGRPGSRIELAGSA